jgi:hypothetical protein
MKDKDIKHLEWVYERMKYVHNENENYDYMIRFREILEALRQPVVSNNEALELSDSVAFANYIEDKWKQYRTITNNEDAWCFKQWLVGK